MPECSVSGGNPAPAEALGDGGPRCHAFAHGKPEKFSHAVSGDVVRGGAQAASDEYDVCASKGFLEGGADIGAIWDRDLSRDSNPDGEEGFCEEGEVGVGDLTEEEFGSGVDEFSSHGCVRGR